MEQRSLYWFRRPRKSQDKESEMSFLENEFSHEKNISGLQGTGNRDENKLVPAPIAGPLIPAPITPWEAALQQVEAHEAGLNRKRFPIHQLRLRDDKLIVGDHELEIDDDGFEQLCRPFKVPPDYLARLCPELRSEL